MDFEREFSERNSGPEIMFRASGFQAVTHSSGYFVGFHDRESLDYRDEVRALRFAVDIGETAGIYEDDIRDLNRGSGWSPSELELAMIQSRITEACEFLGVKVTWFRSLPVPPMIVHRRVEGHSLQMPLRSETELCGRWLDDNGVLIADEVCSRIAYVLEHQLGQVAVDDSGWTSLHVDPADGRFWELSFPKSEMHGGGPPMLACIGAAEAAARYKLPPEPTA